MTEQDIKYQAEKLNDFVRRGGSSRLWFQSKDFSSADRRAIMDESVKLSIVRRAMA